MALIEIEAPLETANGLRQFTDRTRCFESYLALADEWGGFVVQAQDELAAFQIHFASTVLLGGKPIVSMVRADVYVRPKYQRIGINDALAGRTRMWVQTESTAAMFTALVATGNERVEGWTRNPSWKRRLFRVLINCRASAGPAAARRATPDDASAIRDLLNEGHDCDELFAPYQADRLARRLSKIEDYSWDSFLVNDEAALGIWESDEREVEDGPAGRTERRIAIALDYGARHDRSLEPLLRMACGALAAKGFTHLAVIGSNGGRASNLLRALAEDVEEYAFNCATPEPEMGARPGLYFDAVHF
jgi:hypothetical protein